MWGTESALRYLRIKALFRFATPRTRKAQSSPTPPKHFEPFFIPLKEVTQNAEPTAATPDCECSECSAHMRYRKHGRTVDPIPGLWLITLSTSLLLAELLSRPAITGRSMVVCSAAALALASATVRKVHSKGLNSVRRYASELRLWLPAPPGSHNRIFHMGYRSGYLASLNSLLSATFSTETLAMAAEKWLSQ